MIKKPKSKETIKKGKEIKYVGIHLIAEFWGGKIIEDVEEIEKILITAVKKADSIPLKSSFYKFSPQGLTGVVLIAKSHLAIHTWPQINYLALDLFTCGDKVFLDKAFQYLKSKFKPKKIKVRYIKRGTLK